MKQKGTTIYDIAQEVGVSAATVSKALSGKGSISFEMVEKIMATAKRLGYIPNIAAKSLKKKESKQVMLVIPSIRDSFFLKIIEPLQSEAAKRGYNLLINGTEDDKDRELQILSRVMDGFIDGIVFDSANYTKEHFEILKTITKPVVLCSFGAINFSKYTLVNDCVESDTKKGIYLSTLHLLEQQCENVAYAGLAKDTETGVVRLEGYKMAMKEYGMEIDESLIFTGGAYVEYGYEVGKEIAKMLQKGRKIEAICAATDQIALGIYDAFEEENIKIPDRVAIIGMDNTYEGRRCYPKLSTVKLAEASLGKTAAELLFERIDGDNSPARRVAFEPSLIIRDSSIIKH